MLFISLCTFEDARGNVEEDSADVDTMGCSSIQSTSHLLMVNFNELGGDGF
jgi:hypothetical protein